MSNQRPKHRTARKMAKPYHNQRKKPPPKEKTVSLNGTGYHKYFGISSVSLANDSDFDVDKDATKTQIKNAFVKSLKSKKMNKKISEIKNSETPPKIIKNIFDKNEIEGFLKLYNDLPTTVHNKKQNVIKKRWLQGYNEHLEKIFCERLKREIGDFKMDNLKDENGKDILGLIQESYSPIGLHVDAGFDINNQVYKQIPF